MTSRSGRITIRVMSVRYTTPQWSAATGECVRTGSRVTFTTKGAVVVGDEMELIGEFVDTKFGRQFEAEEAVYKLPQTRDGIAAWLANNKAIRGIGATKAAALATAFWQTWDWSLANELQRMAEIARVKIDVMEAMRHEWESGASYNEVAVYLSGAGLTPCAIRALCDRYGKSAVSVVKSSPYALIGAIRGFGFSRVDEIAIKLGVARDSELRVGAAIVEAVKREANMGHTITPIDDVVSGALKLLQYDIGDGLARDVLAKLIGGTVANVGGHLVENPLGFVALDRICDAERNIASWFRGAGESNLAYEFQLCLERNFDCTRDLTVSQQSAVDESIKNRALIISGSAGTGKTYTMAVIAQMYARATGAMPILCAPTGKAAKRLTESTGYEAQTIHRLLGYDGRTFTTAGAIDAPLVIVDEASMVDVELMSALLSRIFCTQTTLIIVGDPSQLPSVGPGSVLADLIERRVCKHVELKQVMRQAGPLLAACDSLRNGVIAPNDPTGAWQVRKSAVDDADVLAAIDAFVKAHMIAKDSLESWQILTPARKQGELATRALNKRIQEMIHHGRGAYKFFVGDKVIQTRNNYSEEIHVMNGTTGEVVDITAENIVVRFFDDGRVVAFDRTNGEADDLELAYALTIHQSQGSEWPDVLVVCHRSHSFMHSRSLLYTACTRAKKRAFIVGDQWGIRNCVERTSKEKRRTLLGFEPSES